MRRDRPGPGARRPVPTLPVVALRDLPGVRLTSLPDCRGWPVELEDGSPVGMVERLLLDLEEHEVRYLDLRLDPRLVSGAPGPSWNALVPIGRVRLSADRDLVRLPGLTRRCVAQLPDTPPLGVTRAVERAVLGWFGEPAGGAEDAFYHGAAFRLGAAMAARRAPAGRDG